MPAGSPGRPSPHDALFRRVLGEPEHAASELRSVLPAELLADLELADLVPVTGSFVDEALRWRHCDLLFATRCRGRTAFVYVLMEHQSSSDRWMALRMLGYRVFASAPPFRAVVKADAGARAAGERALGRTF